MRGDNGRQTGSQTHRESTWPARPEQPQHHPRQHQAKGGVGFHGGETEDHSLEERYVPWPTDKQHQTRTDDRGETDDADEPPWPVRRGRG